MKILDGVGMALALTTDEVVLGPDLDLQVVEELCALRGRLTDRFFEDTNVQETKKSIWVLCFLSPSLLVSVGLGRKIDRTRLQDR